jgi:beta-xylosidase
MPIASDIQIRDPFVVPVPAEGQYFLYGSTDRDIWGGPGTGFAVYTSTDLVTWDGPVQAFRPPPGFWGTTNFWAPELHTYRGRHYLFASFKADGVCRGTQILTGASLLGPFTPIGNRAVTPAAWECLDGTLFVDDAGDPWMVFCHEWVQVRDGEMCAMRLVGNLGSAAAEPIVLFRASEAPWAKELVTDKATGNYVTDGPFLYRAANGDLLMLWSTIGHLGYTIGTARSRSGAITGPWAQDREPLFGKDGGHGMIFRRFDGQLMLSLHAPNNTPWERPLFIPIDDDHGTLRIKPTTR